MLVLVLIFFFFFFFSIRADFGATAQAGRGDEERMGADDAGRSHPLPRQEKVCLSTSCLWLGLLLPPPLLLLILVLLVTSGGIRTAVGSNQSATRPEVAFQGFPSHVMAITLKSSTW